MVDLSQVSTLTHATQRKENCLQKILCNARSNPGLARKIEHVLILRCVRLYAIFLALRTLRAEGWKAGLSYTCQLLSFHRLRGSASTELTATPLLNREIDNFDTPTESKPPKPVTTKFVTIARRPHMPNMVLICARGASGHIREI